ncbi:hypothetical protein ACQP1O_43240 (plasmid) [Nocardia sp. CA-151230]|uniref:hypothetical protein n=1 Tax=Nocardia sp. CA-151230 TaxID=3239982 RepID=UPI003D91CDE6
MACIHPGHQPPSLRPRRRAGAGKIRGILRLIDERWDDIDGDFQDILGVDAYDWIRGLRPWSQFHRHYKRCCRIVGSACHSALLVDPQLAEEAAKLPKAKNPTAFGFSAEIHALFNICDLIIAQIAKDPRASMLPRPLTGADILSQQKRQAAMNKLVATFSPQHVDLTPQLSA